jgi:hypothetical protein
VNSGLCHDLKIPFLQFTQFTLDSAPWQLDAEPFGRRSAWAGSQEFFQKDIALRFDLELKSFIDISIIKHLCQNENSIHYLRLHFRFCFRWRTRICMVTGLCGRLPSRPATGCGWDRAPLYSSIQSLLEEKLIEEVGVREDAKLGQERRRYYRLTGAGRKVARSEAERMADLLRVARSKDILRGDYV